MSEVPSTTDADWYRATTFNNQLSDLVRCNVVFCWELAGNDHRLHMTSLRFTTACPHPISTPIGALTGWYSPNLALSMVLLSPQHHVGEIKNLASNPAIAVHRDLSPYLHDVERSPTYSGLSCSLTKTEHFAMLRSWAAVLISFTTTYYLYIY